MALGAAGTSPPARRSGQISRPALEEVRSLPAGKTRCLLKAARGDRLEVLYLLVVYAGLRQGEPLALKSEDLALEAGTLRVRRTLTHAGGKYSTAEPKTRKSCRIVRLTAGAVAALRGPT